MHQISQNLSSRVPSYLLCQPCSCASCRLFSLGDSSHCMLAGAHDANPACAGGECGVVYTQRWGTNMPQLPGQNASIMGRPFPLGIRSYYRSG